MHEYDDVRALFFWTNRQTVIKCFDLFCLSKSYFVGVAGLIFVACQVVLTLLAIGTMQCTSLTFHPPRK